MVGKMRKPTGRVPIMTGAHLRSRMPHRTLVGQSGPPTRIATVPSVMPSSDRMSFMVRVMTVLTPTSCRTQSSFPHGTPMAFCWAVHLGRERREVSGR